MERRALAAEAEMKGFTENPFKMKPEEIAMWLEGGALPGSVKFEQARAAMDWHIAREQIQAKDGPESGGVHWTVKAYAITGLVASVCTVVGTLHLVGLI
jgi:hypothetical protein